MKASISKILAAGAMVVAFSLNLQASPVRPMAADTGKMSKMSKMDKKMAPKKMSKKMAPKKMMKDTAKMGKMSKM